MDKLLFWNIRSQEKKQIIIQELEHYRRKLGMTNAVANCSSKIWIFWNNEWDGKVITDSHQQITINFKNKQIGKEMIITAVLCKVEARGLPVTQYETIDFAHCINSCSLNELKFIGSKYTWWNGRIEEDCIFKRLDRGIWEHGVCGSVPYIRSASSHKGRF
ncbi:hypothetical protein H5410_003765 [Solanum commersonii]|uniref:Uncharacterized protein n=1 Tax=Solanum commersonii TaxID=4109 RepID=A0A9J6B5X3_SOLCO|nr:hypothetical protein H5410_003765 [Solanum commersonii]